MNLEKLQDTRLTSRNVLLFYTLLVNNQKKKIRKQNKIGVSLTKEVKDLCFEFLQQFS